MKSKSKKKKKKSSKGSRKEVPDKAVEDAVPAVVDNNSEAIWDNGHDKK